MITLGSTKKSTVFRSLLVAAAMTLPSVQFASADTPPERGSVSFKYLNYQESQSGDTALTSGMSRDRIGVNALSVMGVMPFAGKWSVGVSFLEDSIAGASPAYHSSGFPPKNNVKQEHDGESGASGELRHAVDLELTRYYPQGSVTVGSSYSKESDYISRSASLQGSATSEDKNTTLTLGGSLTADTIDPNAMKIFDVAMNAYVDKKQVVHESKQVAAGIVSITRVLTKQDIVQLTLGYSHGNGYYTDPYKDPDNRPRNRNSTTLFTRWNHHFDGLDGTGRIFYRYYSDTFGIRAHTLGAEYVQPLRRGWTVTPLLRLYTQSEADFYVAAGSAETSTIPTPVGSAKYYTEDQRLSAFGALTLGLKVSKQLSPDWLVDFGIERYEQRDEWSQSGKGDPGVATFHATTIKVGLSRQI